MILGNSNKGNTGKKYLMRTKIKNIIPSEQQLNKRRDFDIWFVNNNRALKEQFVNKGNFVEDIFNDTYLRISESLMYSELNIKNFKTYFCRSYYTNYILSKQKENRYIDLKEIEPADIENDFVSKEEFIKEILLFLKSSINEFEYSVFSSWLSDESMSYNECAQLFDIKEYQVNHIIANIRKLVRESFGVKRKFISYKSTLKLN